MLGTDTTDVLQERNDTSGLFGNYRIEFHGWKCSNVLLPTKRNTNLLMFLISVQQIQDLE
ncbi:MAG: hypothetical protein ACI90V_009063, partial [Bacillariaceae sp.]